jgi:hypothetical protein
VTASSHSEPFGLAPVTSLQAAVDGYRAAQDQPAAPSASAPAAAAEVTSYVAQVVEAIATAPTDQARATLQAELEQSAEDREAVEWFHQRLLATAPLYAGCAAVRELCHGRPPTHLLSVEQILTALDGHAPPALPMALSWDGVLTAIGGTVRVPVRTSLGADAVLALAPVQQQEFVRQLAALAPASGACGQRGCGMSPGEIVHVGPPAFSGWILVDVAGASMGPRWCCSPDCATTVMAAAGAELAALDRAAASDPHQQAPTTPAPAAVVVPVPPRPFFTEAPGTDGEDDGEPDWPPYGGHLSTCAYVSGMASRCTCAGGGQ